MKTMQMNARFLTRSNSVSLLFAIVSVIIFIISFLYFSSQIFEWQHVKPELDRSPVSNFVFNDMPNALNALKMLRSIDFEVFGRVQGVFFRRYTREKGKELGLKGWCMNTYQGTVVGVVQGDEEKVIEMRQWLQKVGSPSSKIEKCVFTNERHISKPEFEDFHIKKGNRFVV